MLDIDFIATNSSVIWESIKRPWEDDAVTRGLVISSKCVSYSIPNLRFVHPSANKYSPASGSSLKYWNHLIYRFAPLHIPIVATQSYSHKYRELRTREAWRGCFLALNIVRSLLKCVYCKAESSSICNWLQFGVLMLYLVYVRDPCKETSSTAQGQSAHTPPVVGEPRTDTLG